MKAFNTFYQAYSDLYIILKKFLFNKLELIFDFKMTIAALSGTNQIKTNETVKLYKIILMLIKFVKTLSYIN